MPETVPSHLAADAELLESAEGGLSQEHLGGLATIRLHRRMRLAEKLKDVFELDGINEVLAGKLMLQIVTHVLTHHSLEMPCWLMRSVRKKFLHPTYILEMFTRSSP